VEERLRSVAANITALGAAVCCVGVIGNDHNGRVLKQILEKTGADTTGLLVTDDRPTINKQRLIGLAQHRHQQQLFRMDYESDDMLSAELAGQVLKIYTEKLKQAALVCLQDYNKGLLTASVCSEMIEAAKASGKKVLIDPALTADYSKYSSATAITPNRQEAAAVVGFEIADSTAAGKAAGMLCEKLKLDAVVLTLDREGAYLKTADINEKIPTRARSVYDVTGAGDMVLATLAVALASGCDYRTAVQLSTLTGGIEVEKFGAAAVTVEEVINEIISQNRSRAGKIRSVESLTHELGWHRKQEEKIVFTNGCFDVLHRGHIEFLKFCKSQGDVVVLGLNSDSSVKTIKGPDRPINNQNDRAAVLAALETTDYIVIFDEPEPLELIKKVKPDVLVKGKDWAEKGVVGREFVESAGGKVILAPLLEGKSTTSVIEKIKTVWKKL